MKGRLFFSFLILAFFWVAPATAQEPFIISSESLERIPPKHLNFLEGFDQDVSLETFENAEWTETLMSAQSMVEGYWVRFVVKNNLTTSSIGLMHNFNFEKKLYVKNSLGVAVYPHWKYGEHPFLGEGRIGEQYRIVMPQNEETVIYDFFRSQPFDRYMAMVDGLDRMTIGSWELIRVNVFIRYTGNIGIMTPALLFGFYFFFHVLGLKRELSLDFPSSFSHRHTKLLCAYSEIYWGSSLIYIR